MGSHPVALRMLSRAPPLEGQLLLTYCSAVPALQTLRRQSAGLTQRKLVLDQNGLSPSYVPGETGRREEWS